MNKDLGNRINFGSKFGVVAAAAGSAVGLGNIWKFPYELGQKGGGAFLLVYILCVLLLGLPIMLSEFVIGRRAHLNASGAFRLLTGNNRWSLVGLMGVVGAFLIVCFYFVVSGWGLEYIYQAVVDGFEGKTPLDLSLAFSNFTLNTFRPLFWAAIFMIISSVVLLAGVSQGIERYSKILMPFLVIILVLLSIRSLTMPNSSEGLKFLFKPDFSKISSSVVLGALGQAFFSLSLGMGCMITYGSYIKKSTNLFTTALHVTLIDTLIAILAGVAIFPAVFSLGINPAQGPELVFVTLPGVFTQMPGGYFFAILFFLLLAIAALTSTISLQEVIVAYISEEFHVKRKLVILGLFPVILVLSILCSLSLAPQSALQVFDKSLFDLFDYVTSKILMPLGGFFIALFIGWVYNPNEVRDELSNQGQLRISYYPIYRFLMRYFVPLAILVIFLRELGWLSV